MVNTGLLACRQNIAEATCIIKIIECAASLLMMLLVIYIMIGRLYLECRISFYLVISIFMTLTLTFLVIYALDSDIKLFMFLSGYAYNVYFSILVLKIGLKLLSIIRHSINYPLVKKISITIFIIYQLMLTVALVYSIVERERTCFAQPFLVANVISITAAVLFLVIGVRYNREQLQRLDVSLAQDKIRNPLPKFQFWVVTNFIGQVLVLIQAIIFQINQCQFSQTAIINDICRMLFEFLSFHMGIASTIYFFHLSNQIFIQRQRTTTNTTDNPHAIELVYIDQLSDGNRTLNSSL